MTVAPASGPARASDQDSSTVVIDATTDPDNEPDLRGVTRISPVVVEKIAQRAASEMPEIVTPDTPITGGGVGPHVRARAEVRGGEARITLGLGVSYPARLIEVASAVRAEVSERVASLAGVRVVEVDVEVSPVLVDRRRRVV